MNNKKQIRFNVWQNGQYIATATAENEQEAARMIASRFNLKGLFASYPHIDDYAGQKTSKSMFTAI